MNGIIGTLAIPEKDWPNDEPYPYYCYKKRCQFKRRDAFLIRAIENLFILIILTIFLFIDFDCIPEWDLFDLCSEYQARYNVLINDKISFGFFIFVICWVLVMLLLYLLLCLGFVCIFFGFLCVL